MIKTAVTTTNTRYCRLALATSLASLFSYAAVLTITQSLISEMGRYFGITSSKLSWLYFAQMTGFLVAIISAGAYSDRKGKLPVLVAGAIIMAVGAFALACPSTFTIAVIAVLLMGIGGGFSEGSSMALVADIYSGPRQTSMLNCAQAVFGVGAAITPLVISILLHAGIKWQLGFVGVGISCMISALLAYSAFSMHYEKPVGSHGETANWRILISNRLVLCLAIGLMLYVGAECGQAGWLTAYFEQHLGSAPYQAAFSPAFFWMGITIGRLVGAWASKFTTEVTLTRRSLAAAAICQAILLSLNTSIPGFIATLALGFCLGPIFPTISSYAAAAYPKASGTVLALVTAFGSIGNAVFAPAIGVLADAEFIGMRMALWTCFILLVLNLGIFMRIKSKVQH